MSKTGMREGPCCIHSTVKQALCMEIEQRAFMLSRVDLYFEFEYGLCCTYRYSQEVSSLKVVPDDTSHECIGVIELIQRN